MIRDEDYADPDPVAKGRELGLVVFNGGEDRVLMIDCDSFTATIKHKELIALFRNTDKGRVLAGPWVMTVSKSKNGFHYYYLLKNPCMPNVRVGLQASLGSDVTRECLAWQRVMAGVEPSYLFETPSEAERVREWAREHGVQMELD